MDQAPVFVDTALYFLLNVTVGSPACIQRETTVENERQPAFTFYLSAPYQHAIPYLIGSFVVESVVRTYEYGHLYAALGRCGWVMA